MPFYYLSFCDPKLPKGSQFLGATVIEAEDEYAIPSTAASIGRNPGGEIAFFELGISSSDEIPPEGRKYFDRFVGRDEAMADPHFSANELDEEPERVCADCNNHEGEN